MPEFEKMQGEVIRAALGDCLSGVEGMPSQRARVLQAVRGEVRVRRKLPAVVALAIVLTTLAAVGAAAVLLSMREVVEREALPMALANDEGEVNEMFTNEELAHIIAVARENGMEIPNALLEVLERGEGYWEEETIMALAKAEFGPIPARWTLEQQYWFEETVIAIGFKDVNTRRIPGEGELSYEQALSICEAYLTQTYGASDLRDAQSYAVACTYQAWTDEDGAAHGPEWYFDFEPLDLAHDAYSLTLDVAGNILDEQATLERATDFQAIYDHYNAEYGTPYGWDQRTFIALRKDIEHAQAPENGRYLRALLMTDYIEIPSGALTREQACEIALRESGIDGGYAICAVLIDAEPHPIWKVSVAEEERGAAMHATMLEIDCMTGEVLGRHVRTGDDYYFIHWILQEVHDAVREESQPLG